MNLMIKYFLLILIGLSFVLTACQKEEVPYYNDVERINFDYNKMGLTKDTVNIFYGFVTDKYTDIDLEILLTGYAKDYDREIGLTITTKDAVAGTNYELPEQLILPKGEVGVTIPLRVLRSSDLLETGKKSFLVELKDSKDLLAALNTTLFVTVADEIPDQWIGDESWFMGPYIEDFFGECSQTKYLFVYEQLNVWDFSNWSIWGMSVDASKFLPAKRILKEKLAEYEKENGPLVDPNKGRVTFPD